MVIFSSRPSGYKAGVLLLFFAVVMFIVGYAAPNWATVETFRSIGLWMICTYSASLDPCSFWSVRHIATWFHFVRLLESLCLVGLGLSWIYAVYTNCYPRAFAGPVSRFLEIFTALSGILGFAGCMVYCGMGKHAAEWDRDHVFATFLNSDGKNLDWAFYLATIGSFLSVVAAVVIAVFNKPLDASASKVVIYTTAVFEVQGQQDQQGQQGQGSPVVETYDNGSFNSV